MRSRRGGPFYRRAPLTLFWTLGRQPVGLSAFAKCPLPAHGNQSCRIHAAFRLASAQRLADGAADDKRVSSRRPDDFLPPLLQRIVLVLAFVAPGSIVPIAVLGAAVTPLALLLPVFRLALRHGRGLGRGNG